jgi:hypothetical protein
MLYLGQITQPPTVTVGQVETDGIVSVTVTAKLDDGHQDAFFQSSRLKVTSVNTSSRQQSGKEQWFSASGTHTPGGTRKHLISIKTKHRSLLNIQAALILALTKIQHRIEKLTWQKKKAQSTH